ncbi:MAG: FAD-binding protein [Acidimicrobiia bacterium]|nr:FAD-binding protein [Acidimicrobiia bacterium]
MTSIASLLAAFARDEVPGAPDTDVAVSPVTPEETARVLGLCSEHGLSVRFWGTGTRAGMGYPVEADVLVSTRRMTSVVDWQPDDLTVTVQPGHPADDLHGMLAERGQAVVLASGGTVGGALASASSGPARLRYGPVRDHVLETVLATGDGRVVRAGGRVVKNVTGYDVPRLVTGSLGSLGMICSVTLKLWPVPEAAATVTVTDPERALATAYRPLAILSGPFGARVYLQGTASEVEAQAAELGGEAADGHRWPEDPMGTYVVQVRVPPDRVPEAVRRSPDTHVAQHGVGIVTFGTDRLEDLVAIRSWAEGVGGAAVLVRRPDGADIEPWGSPPETVDVQRRVKAAFDPDGVCNPGILPGRI